MVHSVVAVPAIGKVKRDNQNASYSESRNQNSNGSFAKVLENATNETRDSAMDCHTTTYGADSQIRTFFYQPREYHF